MFDTTENPAIKIIYDGECPVCSAYVTHMRLRENFSTIDLLNIREHEDLIEEYRARHVNVDDGMIVIVDSVEYFGADAVNALALLSSDSGLFNKLNSIIFSNAKVSRFLYPIMRAGRNLLLFILGRSKINQS